MQGLHHRYSSYPIKLNTAQPNLMLLLFVQRGQPWAMRPALRVHFLYLAIPYLKLHHKIIMVSIYQTDSQSKKIDRKSV